MERNKISILKAAPLMAIAACSAAEADEAEEANMCLDNKKGAVEYVMSADGPACESIEDTEEGIVWVTRGLVAEPVKPEPQKPTRVVLPTRPRPKPKPEPKVAPPPPPPPPLIPQSKNPNKEPETKLDKWHQNVFNHLDTCADHWSLSSNKWLDGLKGLMQDAEELGIPINKQAIGHKIASLLPNHLDTCADHWSLSSNKWLDGLKGLMQDAEELGIPIDLTSINHRIGSMDK